MDAGSSGCQEGSLQQATPPPPTGSAPAPPSLAGHPEDQEMVPRVQPDGGAQERILWQ